jgi:ABC-2 type transport system ATP-binding protein
MNMGNCLSVNDLSVQIKKKQILSNITFNVCEGEIVGLLGPNGSGKTTTIKTMAGLIKKCTGHIESFGVSIDYDFENYIRHIGFAFDKANYYPTESGYDNLRFFSNVYRKCSKEEILQCASEVGLNKRIFDKVSTYSFGMRQRLNFAKSILTSAKLIVLDEPFNGIDPAGIVEMRELILRLKKNNGISFVISSHLLNEVESVSDRLLFYKNGNILRDITVNNYLSYNHYIGIANLDDLINTDTLPNCESLTKVGENTVKVTCAENKIGEVLSLLHKKGYIVTSVSSKKAIEDLYLGTVGGGQIE